ncbi:STAS domain-containing protein [Streptomyces longispororuber]|uniref:STAS domain-containing protein n=1 Tax=Streptomyces longispororuber TaxID=68230 RepID=UPI0033F3D1A2
MGQESAPRLVARHVPAGRSTVLMCLSGELDLDTTALLRDEVVRVASRPRDHRVLLLELSALTYCDNAGLYALVGVCQALASIGIAVGVIETGVVTRAAIDRAGLAERLPLRDLTDTTALSA